jgi:hypothetical protein
MIAYCDFIADRVRRALVASKEDIFEPVKLFEIGRVKYDLGPRGEFASTKKTLDVVDMNGRMYRVTIEEA